MGKLELRIEEIFSDGTPRVLTRRIVPIGTLYIIHQNGSDEGLSMKAARQHFRGLGYNETYDYPVQKMCEKARCFLRRSE